MSDSPDIRPWLEEWPYDPDSDARIVKGSDGREILQIRTALGIEQLEMTGRPDGARPHDQESVLEFQLRRFEEAGAEGGLELDAEDCAELFAEGMLYYFRYVRLFQLKRWSETVSDTTRNLKLFDFVHDHAGREEDRNYLEKWRPYIVRMNAIAIAMVAVEREGYEKALQAIQTAIARIEGLDEMGDETFVFERTRSLAALRDVATRLRETRPISPLERLQTQLQRAIDRQEFERAAELRDRIRELKKRQPTEG